MLRSQGKKKAGPPICGGIQANRKQQIASHPARPNNVFQFVGTNPRPKPTTSSMDEEGVLNNLLEDVGQSQAKALPSSSASTATPQYITVSLDDLEEAGIDVQNVNKLTEPQIQNLLAISEQNRKRLAERQSTPSSTAPSVANYSVGVSPQRPNPGQLTVGKSVYKSESSPFRDGSRASTSQQHTGQTSVYRVESEVERVIEVENVVEHELGQETTLNSNGPPRLTREQARGVPEEDTMEEEGEEDLSGPHNGADSQITITITDEGHVKLTDASHQTFFFSRDELSQRDIDAANLTDSNIQDIIQMALPSLVMGRPDTDEPSPKKRQISNSQLSSEHVANNSPHKGSALCQVDPTHHNGVSSSSPSTIGQAPYHTCPTPNLSGISVTPSTSSKTEPLPLYFNKKDQVSNNGDGGVMMIGEEVEVRRQGNTSSSEMAVVRYFRPGYGYKVQFSDGHFEWITESNVQDTKEAPPTPFRTRTRPQIQIDPIQPHPNSSLKKADSGVHPANYNHQRHHPQARMSNSRMDESSTPTNNAPNNFYCSICDQTVNQNELSYIVIRVLACKPCSTSKVLILDEQAERKDTENPSTSSQTNDIFGNNSIVNDRGCAKEYKEVNRTRAVSTPKELQIGVQHRTGITISPVRSDTETFEKETTRIL
uniref:Uncharacterized protein n=1 Tax=Ditylenchus dipsaci TaxID=166011 RepID=A0A915D1A4_9BILA